MAGGNASVLTARAYPDTAPDLQRQGVLPAVSGGRPRNARRARRRPTKTSKLYKNSFELLRVRVQRAIGPDDKIGAGNFLFHRPLRGQALPDLLRRPPAREQPFALGRRRNRRRK